MPGNWVSSFRSPGRSLKALRPSVPVNPWAG
ncbi:hypothetical protein MC885_018556 [Smutsia gigantea]|nr:hypothetical protein MC885_018556 [Smutsia gigantea]